MADVSKKTMAARLHKRRGSVSELLMRAGRLYEAEALARIQRRTPNVRPAHVGLLRQIDADGTRLSELARRAGVSKQAVGQLVDELAELELVQRQADPVDKRAQRVVFTDAGLEQLLVGIEVLDELELQLGGDVNAMTLDRIRRDLARLVPALETLRAAAAEKAASERPAKADRADKSTKGDKPEK